MNKFIKLLAGTTIAIAVSSSAWADQKLVDLLEKVVPSTSVIFSEKVGPTGQRGRSIGTGFVVTVDDVDYMVTNNHVIEGGENIVVYFEKDLYDAIDVEVIGVDKHADIAVLTLPQDREYTSVKFADVDTIKRGIDVVAVGNPHGLMFNATKGIINHTHRTTTQRWEYVVSVQTDAVINQGNSGGPLFDMDGNVVAVNTLIYSGGKKADPTVSSGWAGIGMSVRADTVQNAIDLILKVRGEVVRPALGVGLATLNYKTHPLAETEFGFEIESESGAILLNITEGSSADRAGLKRGDIVLNVNGTDVDTSRDLSVFVQRRLPGDTVVFYVERNGEFLALTFTLEAYNAVAEATPEVVTPEVQEVPEVVTPEVAGPK